MMRIENARLESVDTATKGKEEGERTAERFNHADSIDSKTRPNA